MAEKKLTAYEEELKQAKGKILGFKQIAEANICAIIWKDFSLLYSNRNLKLEDFHFNMWKVFFSISHSIVIKEGKTLDEVTVAFFLEKHPKLKLKMDEYGGVQKITEAGEYIQTDNLESYIHDNQKWIVILKMLDNGFPIFNRISDFCDMTSEQIYSEYSAMLNHMFANAETTIKSESISDGLDELIENLNAGAMVGLPYYNADLLNKETGGRLLGNLDMISGVSNVGKTTAL